MSSLIAFLNDNQFVIATDTLAHEKINNSTQLVNFCCKTFYLPHHKCCIAGQGIAKVLNQFFVFTQEKVIAKDIGSLVTQATKYFEFNVDQNIEIDKLATIFIFGVNDLKNKLEVYKISISKSNKNTHEQIEFGLLHKPEIINIEKILSPVENETIEQILVTLMKEQKRQDDLKSNNDRSVIGGQIQVTTMVYDDKMKDLLFQIKIFNAFEDYEETYFDMLNWT